MNKMDAVKFVKERRRMFDVTGEYPKYNLFSLNISAEDVVKEVEEWSNEHPIETRSSEFLKHYPNASVFNNGAVNMCPKLIDKNYNPSSACHITICLDCKIKYWMQEVE